MATKKTAKSLKFTNIERLDYVLSAKKVDATYRKHVAHLRKVLSPVVKGETCKEILDLHRQGYSNQEIVAAGYNKITVSRQVKEYRTKSTFAILYAQKEHENEGEE